MARCGKCLTIRRSRRWSKLGSANRKAVLSTRSCPSCTIFTTSTTHPTALFAVVSGWVLWSHGGGISPVFRSRLSNMPTCAAFPPRKRSKHSAPAGRRGKALVNTTSARLRFTRPRCGKGGAMPACPPVHFSSSLLIPKKHRILRSATCWPCWLRKRILSPRGESSI